MPEPTRDVLSAEEVARLRKSPRPPTAISSLCDSHEALRSEVARLRTALDAASAERDDARAWASQLYDLLATATAERASRQADGDADQNFLRCIVDAAWMQATESTAVPSTEWADRIIGAARVIYAAARTAPTPPEG